jgi:hypothetical protein
LPPGQDCTVFKDGIHTPRSHSTEP